MSTALVIESTDIVILFIVLGYHSGSEQFYKFNAVSSYGARYLKNPKHAKRIKSDPVPFVKSPTLFH
jgi:hypothetical protein